MTPCSRKGGLANAGKLISISGTNPGLPKNLDLPVSKVVKTLYKSDETLRDSLSETTSSIDHNRN